MIDISDTRCVFCGASELMEARRSGSSEFILHVHLTCTSCGGTNDTIGRVPFIGGYEPDDFMGLIEVVATAKMNEAGFSINVARQLHALLGEYHAASDRKDFLASHPNEMVRAPWFANNRYHEWLHTESIIAERDLSGKSLLNVGAGLGIDSVNLIDRGARVTCIDYSPLLVSAGRRSLPTARWFGGFSHVLPFQDESFDMVCANAALHHMRSVPIALREMLRVLKPGGFLFTTGDPIRPDDSPKDMEFDIYNRHEGVLAGINEGIVPFGEIWDTLAAYAEHLDIALIADVAEADQLAGASPIGTDVFNDCWVPAWPENIARLRQSNGGLAVAVTKRTSLPIPAETQLPFVLPAGLLASWLDHEATAFTRLMPWAPDNLIDLPFPGREQTRFDLMNGWMMPEPPFELRRGFRRARWLLRVPRAARVLEFEARAPEGTDRMLQVLLDGMAHASFAIGPDWTRCIVSDVPGNIAPPVLVELGWRDQPPAGAAFDASVFEIRHRRWGLSIG